MGRDSGALKGERRARDRILRIGLLTTLANRGVALLVPLVTLPILLTGLGADRYGVWVTSSSVAAILVVLDLGVGNATLTQIAATRGTAARIATIRTMYVVACLLSMAMIVAWCSLCALVEPSTLFGAEPIEHADTLINIVVVAGAAQMPAMLVYRVQIGLGRQGVSNSVEASGSAALIGGLLVAASQNASPVVLVASVSVVPLGVAITYTAACAVRYRKWLRTLLTGPGQRVGSQLHIGVPIFVVSMLMLVAQNFDPLLVGRTLGYGAVQEFAVPFRIFTALSALAVMVSAPLWALNADALSRGDHGWVIRRSRQVAIMGAALVALVSAALFVTGPALVERWLQGALVFDPLVWAAFGALVTVQAFTGPYFMIQNSVAFMRFQLVAYGIVLLLLPVKILVLDAWGVSGLVLLLLAVQVGLLLPCALAGSKAALARKERNA